MLDIPPHIRTANIISDEVRYRWDEWNVQGHYMVVDEAEFNRFDALTNKANLGLTLLHLTSCFTHEFAAALEQHHLSVRTKGIRRRDAGRHAGERRVDSGLERAIDEGTLG